MTDVDLTSKLAHLKRVNPAEIGARVSEARQWLKEIRDLRKQVADLKSKLEEVEAYFR